MIKSVSEDSVLHVLQAGATGTLWQRRVWANRTCRAWREFLRHDPRRTAFLGAALALVLAPAGCAPVRANYPQDMGPHKWVSKLKGPTCEFKGIVFKVREESVSLESRNMIDSLRERMAASVGKAEADATFEQAQKGHEYSTFMREDRNYVFYRGSLALTREMEIVLQHGCLLLTIRTKDGVVKTRDEGILIPRHSDLNEFADSGLEPVAFDLSYNDLQPGDENRIQVRSRVFGTITSIAVDPDKLKIEE